MVVYVLAYGPYIALAFGLALAVVFSGAIAAHFGRLVRNEPAPWVFVAIVAAIMVAPIGMQRVLSAGLAGFDASIEDVGNTFWVSRIATLVVVALCAERLLRFFMLRERRPALAGWPLFWAFCAFALSSQLLNGMLGANRDFDHKWLYAFLAYFAFFVVAQQQPERCFAFARSALLLFLVGSAAVAPIWPSMVIEFGYVGALPGFSVRYYGLATHANTMGPLTLALMVVLWRYPFGNRWLNRFAWTMAAGSLVLSQSKTSLAIGAGLWLYLAAYNYRARLSGEAATRFSIMLWCLAFLAAAVLAGGILAGVSYFDWADGKLDTVAGSQWASLSGRTHIWELAWKEFTAHPVFGYGPSIWDPIYRFQAGMPFATHAHNQLLQSLSAGGLVAGGTLIFYVLMLVRYALRAARMTGGVSVALVTIMLVRSLTEVPFSTAGVMGTEFFVHLLALTACLVGLRHAASVAPASGRGCLPIHSRSDA